MGENKPLISVVIPAYNIDAYIERCLKSVANQTYKNLEIIVINDGSKDNTKKVAEDFAKTDSRVKVISIVNGGVSNARNTGIDLAKGEFIGFVDGDDEIEEDMYELLLNNALKYDADISHCGYKMVFPSKEVEYYGTKELKVQNTKESLVDLLTGYPIEPSMCNKLYKRELFSDIKLDSEIKYNEDLLINFYLFKESAKSVFEDLSKYHYMLRKGSAATSKISSKKMKDPIIVWNKIKSEVKADNELYNKANSRYVHILFNNTLVPAKALDEDAKQIQKEHIKMLKEALKTESLSSSFKIVATAVAYAPRLMRFAHHIYQVIRGTNKRYEVE